MSNLNHRTLYATIHAYASTDPATLADSAISDSDGAKAVMRDDRRPLDRVRDDYGNRRGPRPILPELLFTGRVRVPRSHREGGSSETRSSMPARQVALSHNPWPLPHRRSPHGEGTSLHSLPASRRQAHTPSASRPPCPIPPQDRSDPSRRAGIARRTTRPSIPWGGIL